ncbi:MAG TPA: GntR family transcriptional regulator [Steroidobacteraceae bacterium]|nr:GntR family transcriptional regulator [Steroidobacteraceae bacterium]
MASIPRSRLIRPSRTPAPELASRPLDKGVARYYRLYELLSAALQDGTIAPGSALPSEPELCARHGISRTTVRRALDRLEREERIVRRRGSGTYARPQRAAARFCIELHALPQTLVALESRTTATTLRFDPAPVPAALTAIAAEIGSTAYLLERLRCSQGEPLSLDSAYLPEPIGRRIRRRTASRASVMTMVNSLGPLTAAVRCSVGTVAADAEAARVLKVPLGAPLLRVRAVLTDGAGRLRAVLESLCRSDRLRLKLMEDVR